METSSNHGDGWAGSSNGDGESDSDSDSGGDVGGSELVNRGSIVGSDASVDVSPAADTAMPDDGPEVPAAEGVDLAVPAGDPVTPSEGPELTDAELVSQPAVMSPAETAAERTARVQLETYNKDHDDAPRALGITRAQIRSLARKSSAPID